MRILIDTNVLILAVLFPNSTVQKKVKNIIHRVPTATYQYIAEKMMSVVPRLQERENGYECI